MSKNTPMIERVSKALGVPEKELVKKGLEGLLQSQLRTCSAEINEIKSRYSVKNSAELEQKIEKGTVAEQPAWEDLILLENLEERTKIIRRELTALRHE